MTNEPSPVTIRSAWRGLAVSYAGAALPLAGGIYGTAASGGSWFAWLLLALGVVLAGTMLFDYPLSSTFTMDGVIRRMPLRRQMLTWTEGDRITRTRPSANLVRRQLAHGPLVLARGRRRYLLCNVSEGRDEFYEINEIVEAVDRECDIDLGVDELVAPAADTPPTQRKRQA